MTTIETSIIVRTFNEERYLPGLLEALAGQRYRNFEVINVDSGSYDRTTEISKKHGCRILRIDSHDFTFGYSLNVGIEAARGRFLAIVSAHAKPVDDLWLEKLVTPLLEERIAMVYGRQYGVASSKYGEAKDLGRTFGAVPRVMRPPRFLANNANSAITAELWQEHRFDESLPGQEDIEWAKYWMERGYRVKYEPEAGVYHIHDETWRQVRKRYYREAVATEAIGVWSRKHFVPLALREAGYAVADLASALREGQLLQRGREIAWFRANKAYGTVSGLLDGKAMSTPAGREALLFDRRCKAVVIHDRNQASLSEIDVPAIKPGDVLVRVAYAGVGNVDLAMYSGDKSFHQGSNPTYPMVPGHELSGWVAEVGANVAHVREGDAVAVQSPRPCGSCEACRESNMTRCRLAGSVDLSSGMGSYAEYVSASGQFVHKAPSGSDIRGAVLCEPLAIVTKALSKLNMGGLSQSTRFAVVGAGPVGHLCAQLLSIREYPVTVFDRNPRRLEYFDGTTIETESDLAGLERFDVLVEATGDPGSLRPMFEASKPGATVLLLGLPYSRRQFTAPSSATFDKTMIWSFGAGSDDYREAMRLLPQIPMDRLTDWVFPLSQFHDAWDSYSRGDHLKVLLKVQESDEP